MVEGGDGPWEDKFSSHYLCRNRVKSSRTEDTHSRSPVKKSSSAGWLASGRGLDSILLLFKGKLMSAFSAFSLKCLVIYVLPCCEAWVTEAVSAISPNSPLLRLLQPQWDATFLEPPPLRPPSLSLVSCIHWRGVLMISTHLCPLFRYSHLLRTSWEHPLLTLWVTMTPSVMCTYTLWSLLVLLATVFAQT